MLFQMYICRAASTQIGRLLLRIRRCLPQIEMLLLKKWRFPVKNSKESSGALLRSIALCFIYAELRSWQNPAEYSFKNAVSF